MGVCKDEMPSQEYGSHIGPIGGPIAAIPFGGGIFLYKNWGIQISGAFFSRKINVLTNNNKEMNIVVTYFPFMIVVEGL